MHKINSATFLELVNNRSIINHFFHRDLPVFPLFLTQTLAEYPFDSVVFSFGAEIYKLEIFKNFPLTKISTREI